MSFSANNVIFQISNVSDISIAFLLFEWPKSLKLNFYQYIWHPPFQTKMESSTPQLRAGTASLSSWFLTVSFLPDMIPLIFYTHLVPILGFASTLTYCWLYVIISCYNLCEACFPFYSFCKLNCIRMPVWCSLLLAHVFVRVSLYTSLYASLSVYYNNIRGNVWLS